MFGSVETRVRPIRVAHLVDPGATAQVRAAIRLSSTLWGGMYSPIVPVYRRAPRSWKKRGVGRHSAREVVLGYIEAFDPDILFQYCTSIPGYIAELGLQVESPDSVWEPSDTDRSHAPRYGIGVPELLNAIFDEYFKYKPKYPVRVVVPQIPPRLALFWASYFGELPDRLHEVLKSHYYEPLDIEETQSSTKTWKEIVSGAALFPRRITDWGIRRSGRRGASRSASLYFLDATNLDDVIDYWNLRATGREVLPVPAQFVGDRDFLETVAQFALKKRRWTGRNRDILDLPSMICGRSRTMDEMEDCAAAMRSLGPVEEAAGAEPLVSLQHWYPRIWDAWARDKDSAVPCDVYGEAETDLDLPEAKELKFRFTPLLPSFAERFAPHSAPRCANEVALRFYGSGEYLAEALPRSSAGDQLTRAISSFGSSRHDWRLGRNGLVHLVQHRWTSVRHIPSAATVFFAWLADHGWTAKLSPPGVLATQLYRRLEGHPIVLRNETLLGLLERMNGGQVGSDGTPRQGGGVGPGRELSVGEVKTRLGSDHGDLASHLAEKGVFRLGLRIQCPNCTRSFWASLETLSDQLPCPLCQEALAAIGTVEGGTWCYRTAGPFSVPGYGDGSYAVLLALEFFEETRLGGLRATRVPSFVAEAAGKRSLEADYAVLWQDSYHGDAMDGVLFGESKTYGHFQDRDFARMRHLARSFPGAVLVFSTLRRSLTKKEITGITRIAEPGRKYWKAERPLNPVLILTGTELLDLHGPPYCWDETVQKELGHPRGLLGLCDATQRLYLNLPSWESEWHELWEKKRKRREKAT